MYITRDELLIMCYLDSRVDIIRFMVFTNLSFFAFLSIGIYQQLLNNKLVGLNVTVLATQVRNAAVFCFTDHH